jgi:phage shock protein A
MSDLIDKLNVLLRSNLNNLLGGNTDRGDAPKLPPDKLGKDVDREIAALRKRIDAALNEEDSMKARLETLRQQVADFDQQTDQALQRGNDSQARQLVGQMQRVRRQAESLQTDLTQHQEATFALIQQVNTLEAMVSDARRAQAEAPQAPTAPPADEPLAPPKEAFAPKSERTQSPERPPSSGLGDMLREVRERVESVITPRSAPTAPPTPPPAEAEPKKGKAPDDAEVEADLARRRTRLSKPE